MRRCGIVFTIAAVIVASCALAKDKVRLVDSQASVFDQFAIHQAQAEGYFDAENLDVSIIVGRGGSAALQILTTGNAEMLMAPGIFSVIAAYAKAARTMRALWKGQQYNFGGDKALTRYAEHWKIDLEEAKKMYDVLTLDDFKFTPIKGLDDMLQSALDYGFINQPLTAEEKKGLVAEIANEPSR